MTRHVFVFPGGSLPPSSDGVRASLLPPSPDRAAAAIDMVLRDPEVDVLLFWDTNLGAVPPDLLHRFERALDDAWHPGLRSHGGDIEDLLSFAQPLSIYRRVPPPALEGAVNWRLDLRALLVRANVLRRIGSLDPDFESLEGAGHELGYRMIRRGGVIRQQPALFALSHATSPAPPLADRYRLLRRYFGAKWGTYTVARRLMLGASPLAEMRAWKASARRGPAVALPAVALERELREIAAPTNVTVSIILPTFGRYRYVAEVLEDIRAQTIAPSQILIADGNPPSERQPEVYERFKDLPIEVLWHEEPGICSGRNACLQRVTGDYVWFVDDDSRIDATNLAAHLKVLSAYGADVSVGPAFTRSRPELHGEQREVVCTHMDCGTTLCKRALIDQVGGFDMEFNEYLAGEDGELGIRFIRAGGLMVNNPFAKRFHYVAPVGGSRSSKRSVHRFTRWSSVPRPVQSIYYTAKRYFEPHVAWDAMLQGAVLAGWRRREGVPATRRWRVTTMLGELVAIPMTAWRLRRSVQMGREMVARGPLIPALRHDVSATSLRRSEP